MTVCLYYCLSYPACKSHLSLPYYKLIVICCLCGSVTFFYIHSFSILTDDRSKASSKTTPPHSAI